LVGQRTADGADDCFDDSHELASSLFSYS